ncbi:unnamed protein product [Adineta ricciae]|uniref:EGF-like domain-containing protein n=1 Tax=Adineta ricciae TaxID=249248 RepID=A0A815IP59_ADIRI|nr:unnamed protein product [Adineta ricciae]
MIINVTLLLIFMRLKEIHGYLSCAGDLVPCRNKTHCIPIEDVCTTFRDCMTGDRNEKPVCHYCGRTSRQSRACLFQIDKKSDLEFNCLSKSVLCTEEDDEKRCMNGIDRDPYICENLCRENEMHCPSGECVLTSQKCDQKKDCYDGFDEENCPPVTTPVSSPAKTNPSSSAPVSYICALSATPTHAVSLPIDHVCDGYKDCPMNDDESYCNNKCTSSSPCPSNSDATCLEHPTTHKLCRCSKPGYRISANTSKCQDFDECTDFFRDYCSFKCANTDGSYNCSCPSGFTYNKDTKTCRKDHDLSKPDLLVVLEDRINLYNILNSSDSYTANLRNTISVTNGSNIAYVQYDPLQKFVIYYDYVRHSILCKKIDDGKTIVLLSNLIVHGFVYNVNERNLFVLERHSDALLMYSPITCDTPSNIKMHSWIFDDLTDGTHEIRMDIFNRKLIFASKFNFMISDISQPNVTKIVFNATLPIKHFLYDSLFERVFWTEADGYDGQHFSVFTCNNQFKQCHNTSFRLPTSISFGFFNDALLYSTLTKNAINVFQLYGTRRFTDTFMVPMETKIHSFLLLDHQQTDRFNLCRTAIPARCPNQLCLQVNSTNTQCLSIDGERTSYSPNESTKDDTTVATDTSKPKSYRYRPTNTILFFIIAITCGIFVAILLVRVFHRRLLFKSSQNPSAQLYIATEEPNLDEFGLSDDRNGDRLPLTNQLYY